MLSSRPQSSDLWRIRPKEVSWKKWFGSQLLENSVLEVLLYKTYPVLEEKVGKCVDFGRYIDCYVVFEMFRGERLRIRHRSLVCADVLTQKWMWKKHTERCSVKSLVTVVLWTNLDSFVWAVLYFLRLDHLLDHFCNVIIIRRPPQISW